MTISLETAAGACLIALPFAVNRPPLVAEAEGFALREWHTSITSLLRIWGEVNHEGWQVSFDALELQDSKPFLLWLAGRFGLAIPTWEVYRGIRLPDPLVGKAINAYQEVAPSTYYSTRKIPSETRQALRRTSLDTPALTQEYIEHDTELRVYVSGSREVAAMLKRKTRQSIDDFRTARTLDLQCTRVDDVQAYLDVEKVRSYMNHLQLRYCAFDFLLLRDRALLVDVNPVGSWAYLAHDFGLDLTSEIVEGFTERHS